MFHSRDLRVSFKRFLALASYVQLVCSGGTAVGRGSGGQWCHPATRAGLHTGPQTCSCSCQRQGCLPLPVLATAEVRCCTSPLPGLARVPGGLLDLGEKGEEEEKEGKGVGGVERGSQE